ncbi:MAG: hypothetical protein RR140_02620 [Clostridia bacterium]
MEEKTVNFVNPLDGEVFNNKADIALLMGQLEERLTENVMLGSWTETGKYEINEQLLTELALSQKILLGSMDKIDRIYSCVGSFELDFVLEIQNVGLDKIASLYILEKINYFGKNIKQQKSFVAGYRDKDDNNFLEKVKDAFNIISGEDSDLLDLSKKNSVINLQSCSKVFLLKKTSKQEWQAFLNENEKECKSFVQKYLNFFKTSKNGKNFLLNFKNEIQQNIGIFKEVKNKNVILKDILIKLLTENKNSTFNDEEKKTLNQIKLENPKVKNFNPQKSIIPILPASVEVKKEKAVKSAEKPYVEKPNNPGGGDWLKSGKKEEKKEEKKEKIVDALKGKPNEEKAPVKVYAKTQDIPAQKVDKKNASTVKDSSINLFEKEYKNKFSTIDGIVNANNINEAQNLIDKKNNKNFFQATKFEEFTY